MLKNNNKINCHTHTNQLLGSAGSVFGEDNLPPQIFRGALQYEPWMQELDIGRLNPKREPEVNVKFCLSPRGACRGSGSLRN